MSNVSQWSTAAAGNNDQPPDGAPEGQAPSSVNNTIRELMAAVRRWYEDTSAKLTTGGVADAYTLTTSSAHALLADQSLLVAKIHATNTGASTTLDVDALGIKSIVLPDGTNPPAGALAQDAVVVFAYESVADVYILIGGRALGTAAARNVGTASGQLPDAINAGILSRVGAWDRQQHFALATLADGDPITWNLDENQVAQVTLGGNRTINATNQRAGGFYALLAKQDATGGRQPTFGAEFDFGAFGVPGLTQTASFGDILSFFSDGTKMMFVGITRGFDFT